MVGAKVVRGIASLVWPTNPFGLCQLSAGRSIFKELHRGRNENIMGYSYAEIEETPNVLALKTMLAEASKRAGEVQKSDPAEYARRMREVMSFVGQLAIALEANERACSRGVVAGGGVELAMPVA